MIEEKENRRKLGNGYFLCNDRFCWWISRISIQENGKERLNRVSGYHRDVTDAFLSLSDYVTRSFESKSITTLIKEVKGLKSLEKQLAEEIKEVLNERAGHPNGKKRMP